MPTGAVSHGIPLSFTTGGNFANGAVTAAFSYAFSSMASGGASDGVDSVSYMTGLSRTGREGSFKSDLANAIEGAEGDGNQGHP